MASNLVMDVPQTSTGLKLQVRRVIKAKREQVFNAWTRPEMMQQWFAPGNMVVPSAKNDLRIGGAYRIEMLGSSACDAAEKDADGYKTAIATGTYKAIIPNELICFTWQGDCDSMNEQTLVTVQLKDVEGGTELILTHEGFAAVDSRDRHQQGWQGCLAKLELFCEK